MFDLPEEDQVRVLMARDTKEGLARKLVAATQERDRHKQAKKQLQEDLENCQLSNAAMVSRLKGILEWCAVIEDNLGEIKQNANSVIVK